MKNLGIERIENCFLGLSN